VVVTLLLASAVAVAVAPALMPESYSWLADSVSESAGQGVERAWLARAGLLLYGFAVLLLTGLAAFRWGRWGTLLHGIFGVCIIAAAVYAARPWDPTMPYVEFEDLLHSIAASVMGPAFAIGVAVVSARRPLEVKLVRLLDLVAVVASVVVPMAMFSISSLEGYSGLFQRAMFAISYTWYAQEAIRSSGGRLAGPATTGAPASE
jgi:hypothetical protein